MAPSCVRLSMTLIQFVVTPLSSIAHPYRRSYSPANRTISSRFPGSLRFSLQLSLILSHPFCNNNFRHSLRLVSAIYATHLTSPGLILTSQIPPPGFITRASSYKPDFSPPTKPFFLLVTFLVFFSLLHPLHSSMLQGLRPLLGASCAIHLISEPSPVFPYGVLVLKSGEGVGGDLKATSQLVLVWKSSARNDQHQSHLQSVVLLDLVLESGEDCFWWWLGVESMTVQCRHRSLVFPMPGTRSEVRGKDCLVVTDEL